MKRLIIISAAIAVLAASCTKEGQEQGGEQLEQKNCIEVVDAEGNVISSAELKSTVSFVSEAGMYSIYAADVADLTKEKILDGYTFMMKHNVVAVSCLYSLLGSKVDINTEILHWLMHVQVSKVCEYDLLEGDLEPEIAGGYFIFDIDKEAEKSSLEVQLELKDGKKIICKSNGTYTPGGENETLFVWNDMSRPVRAAFYDDTETGSNPPLMYFTSGQIDYGADIPRTTYAKILPSAKLCDGQPHDIVSSIKDGSLQFMVRDFDSEWNVVGGSIMIKHIQGYEYEVNVTGAECEDINHELVDRSFRMFFHGELKDIHIERQIINQFETGGKTYLIKSCIVDLSAPVAAIYMLQDEGIKTVAEALQATPLVINFSREKFGTSIGLSTDKTNFCVSYTVSRWDASNLDTGSFICHEYNAETGLLHCQLANICLASNYKTVMKMEYKGTPVYIK